MSVSESMKFGPPTPKMAVACVSCNVLFSHLVPYPLSMQHMSEVVEWYEDAMQKVNPCQHNTLDRSTLLLCISVRRTTQNALLYSLSVFVLVLCAWILFYGSFFALLTSIRLFYYVFVSIKVYL